MISSLVYLYFSLSVLNNSGCKSKEHGPLLKELMQTTNFRVTVVEESDVVEICGALKVPLIDLHELRHLAKLPVHGLM